MLRSCQSKFPTLNTKVAAIPHCTFCTSYGIFQFRFDRRQYYSYGPQGHQCSLNFFQKALHTDFKSFQKNFWSGQCSLKHLLGQRNNHKWIFDIFEGELQGNF